MCREYITSLTFQRSLGCHSKSCSELPNIESKTLQPIKTWKDRPEEDFKFAKITGAVFCRSRRKEPLNEIEIRVLNDLLDRVVGELKVTNSQVLEKKEYIT